MDLVIDLSAGRSITKVQRNQIQVHLQATTWRSLVDSLGNKEGSVIIVK